MFGFSRSQIPPRSLYIWFHGKGFSYLELFMVNKTTEVILQWVNLTQVSKFQFEDVLFGCLGFIKKFLQSMGQRAIPLLGKMRGKVHCSVCRVKKEVHFGPRKGNT